MDSVSLLQTAMNNWQGKWFHAALCGVYFFLVMKLLMYFPETEFLYFNF